MLRSMTMGILAAMALGMAACSDGEGSRINGAIHVSPGQQAGDEATVNGSVDIGENASVKNLRTVNGNITLRSHAAAASAVTVNGSARLEQGARLSGDIEIVNGDIELAREADVTGKLVNVNGSIQLNSAHVGGGLQTVNGDITIGEGSRLEGGIRVQKETGSFFHFGPDHVPRIVIGPNAVVSGTMSFERPVKLYVSDKATVGSINGASAIKYSGDQPPG